MADNKNAFSKEEVLAHLSHRPEYILNSVITLDDSAELSLANFDREPQSSLGLLDDLPLELLHVIFDYLDLLSLLQFSHISLCGRAVVERLPAFKYAGHIFPILSQTEVISLHSVATFHTALRSDRCISCGQYGAFLFLLSAERCCHACLSYNQSLWLMPPIFAGDFFGLTRQQIKTLPTMRSIPGSYKVRDTITRYRPTILTSVRAAKELAIKLHGSEEAMRKKLARKRLKATSRRPGPVSWYRDAPLQPFSQEILTSISIAFPPGDPYGGMGSVAFPSIIGNKVENGLWCQGCEQTFDLYVLAELDDVIHQFLPPGCHPNSQSAFRFFDGLQYRARSEEEFLEHARHCYSATELITKC